MEASRAACIGALSLLGIAGAMVMTFASAAPEAASALPNKQYVLMVSSDSGGPPAATPTRPPAAATPTTVPSPTATPPSSSGTVYTSGALLWKDSIDYWHVTGFVTNGLSVPIEFVRVTANFYSRTGQLLATSFTFSSLNTIPAGGTSPFEVLLTSKVAGVETADIQVTDYDTRLFRPPVSGLTAEITNTFVDSIGFGHLVGKVRNNGSQTYDYVQPIVALIRDSRVVSVDFTFTSPRKLAPGQTGTFEVLVLPHEGFKPVSFTGLGMLLLVDGDPP